MIKRLKFLVLFILMLFTFSHAQVLNIEKIRLDQDSLKPLKLKLIANAKFYNRSAGENDLNKSLDIDFNLNSIYEPNKHAYILIAALDYDRTNGKGILDFGYIHGRVNWLQDRKLSYETFVQISYDNSRGMDYRYLVGANIRYNILRDEQNEIFLATGLMYENEKWQHPYNINTTQSKNIKSNNYVSYKLKLNDMLDINNVLYYQTGIFKNKLTNRLNNQLILNTRITKLISLYNSVEMSYDDKPIVPITKFIYTVKMGIGLNI